MQDAGSRAEALGRMDGRRSETHVRPASVRHSTSPSASRLARSRRSGSDVSADFAVGVPGRNCVVCCVRCVMRTSCNCVMPEEATIGTMPGLDYRHICYAQTYT